MVSYHHVQYQKKLTIQSWENLVMDGQTDTDRRMDDSDFIGCCQTMPSIQKSFGPQKTWIVNVRKARKSLSPTTKATVKENHFRGQLGGKKNEIATNLKLSGWMSYPNSQIMEFCCFGKKNFQFGFVCYIYISAF